MPRRSSRQVISASALTTTTTEQLPAPNTELPDDNKSKLRRSWKWAAFTQFFYMFFDLFAFNDISAADIENDLVYGTDIFLPRVMQRLLYTLTFDRKITIDNWQNALRKQYDKRDPDANPLGPAANTTATNSRLPSILKEEPVPAPQSIGPNANPENGETNGEPSETPASRLQTEDPLNNEEGKTEEEQTKPVTVDWSSLDIPHKLDSLHTLVEWQFQNPLRLRGLMKSDDETASWRSEPVGYDRQQNAYWLIGGDRLWIQRVPPKPPSKKRKRKDASLALAKQKGRAGAKQKSIKRRKTLPVVEIKVVQPSTPHSRNRAAKELAKVKLDAQAKALAEYQRQAIADASPSYGRSTRSTRNTSKVSAVPAPSTGTRTSSRLRHLEDDGWEQVPQELLQSNTKRIAGKTGLESDDESFSDLTELTDDGEDAAPSEPEEEVPEEIEKMPTPEPELQQGFVEWETLCVTLAEWENFPEQFAKSTHYLERSFYKYLTTELVPEVTAGLRQLEQKRKLEEALNHRKRSSRLAHKENEKEAARLAAQRKAEDEEKFARTRRLQARQQREAEERERRERAREERRANRDARVSRRAADGVKDEEDNETSEGEDSPAPPTNGKAKAASKSSSGSRTPANDEWELDCEICGRRGKNLDDGYPMMSCGQCSKWQHIACHDKADASQGRPKRDWDKIEFFCRRCLAQRRPSRTHTTPSAHQPTTAVYSYPTQGWSNGSYPDPRTHSGHHNSSAYARSGLAQTSGVRSSVYPPPHAGYAPSQPSTISFSHYQPQERAFSSDPIRTPHQTHHNPYLRANGAWTADTMKYHQAYGSHPWNPNYPSSDGSVPTHQTPVASGSSSLPPSHQVDMGYHRSTYHTRQPPPPPPLRDHYQHPYNTPGYAAAPSHPQSVPMQPYSHARTPYPPQS